MPITYTIFINIDLLPRPEIDRLFYKYRFNIGIRKKYVDPGILPGI